MISLIFLSYFLSCGVGEKILSRSCGVLGQLLHVEDLYHKTTLCAKHLDF